jgi:hypothetical protein
MCIARHSAIVAAAFVIALSGCSSATAPEDQLIVAAVQPLPTRDSLGFSDLRFQVTNTGDRTLFLETCGGVVAADLQQRTTTLAWSPIPVASLCYSSFYAGPYRLDPGSTVAGVQRGKIPAGEYRLRIAVGRTEATVGAGSAFSEPIQIP